MTIETDFRFAREVTAPPPAALAAMDLRGRLAGFLDDAPMGNSVRQWTGTGFNLIWRPNFGGLSGPKDFFIELNLTNEKLDFTDVTGATGVANRGLLQPDIFLGGIAYVQQINDAFDNTGQHFEPGFWNNVPSTGNRAEPTAVVRMGSIPHGTSIQLQGVSFTVPAPVTAASSITPVTVGSPDDGQTGLFQFPEEILADQTNSRTPLVRLSGRDSPVNNAEELIGSK